MKTLNKSAKKIIIAKSAGFCWGVNRAFDKLLEVAKKTEHQGQLYTYGPLIHNPQAVAMLEREGVKVLRDIPEKMDGAVFVRTHGISPLERAKLKACGATIYDATCPDVGVIQGIVKKHLKRGYHIVIVGNSQHPEVKALLGFAEGRGMAISSTDDIAKIPPKWKKICIVAQSTQKEEDFIKITEILEDNYEYCKIYNTICKSTAHRQKEVIELAKKVDAIVVVGGYNSSNTNKLAQISRETDIPTFHIEDASELNLNDFKDFAIIGITAGSSTPSQSIEKVIEKIKEIGEVETIESFSVTTDENRKRPAIFLTSGD